MASPAGAWTGRGPAMSEKFASPDGAQEREPFSFTHLAGEKIRSPHGIPNQSMSSLVEQWSTARLRTLLAQHSATVELDCEDLFVELTYGARIAQEALAGRWCVVADLLRAGAVESWMQVGFAMGLTETEARDGFHAWIAGQVDLRRCTGTIGFTDTQASELYALAEAVVW
ncbi:hypothetical protein JOF56_004196 [Kibdelosporangium banguiense]|uniref:Uncharacterized protein n=1 Tax=Kibdelosporangium banguiense TaxID=1365924 RepID=A0ABS4THI9_9PSEU|nr:hypothetical protein [Kibdelosporangium banguiense]MBP2323811.1 hypothetical protein [Kibdelosporangium banguiense]